MTTMKPKPSAEEKADAEQQWANLIAQFKKEWPRHLESRLKSARLLYEIKRWLKEWGQNKGCKGRWMDVLRSFNPAIPISTANDYVCLWQEHTDMPPEDCVLARRKTKKTQQHWENNLPDSGKLAAGSHRPTIKAAREKNHDRSSEQRLGVECVFVLTMAEKERFMDAVKALGPLIATQEMYRAVIAKASAVAPKVDGVGA